MGGSVGLSNLAADAVSIVEKRKVCGLHGRPNIEFKDFTCQTLIELWKVVSYSRLYEPHENKPPHIICSEVCFGSYMDAPGLPSIYFMMSQQEKIAPIHPDFGAAFGAAVPDGIC